MLFLEQEAFPGNGYSAKYFSTKEAQMLFSGS